jgi:intracellular septation protein A
VADCPPEPTIGTTHTIGTIHLPAPRELFRNAGSHVFEGVIAPTATFYTFMTLAGLRPALIAALVLSYSIVTLRAVRSRRVPGLVALSAVLITARTIIAFATNNAFIYFIQPSLGNFFLALLFLGSVAKRKPMTRTLADDFCSFPASLNSHVGLHQFFCRLTLLWACVLAANGAGSLLLLTYGSLSNFMLIKPMISYGLTGSAILLSYLWFRRSMGSAGMRVAFSRPLAA